MINLYRIRSTLYDKFILSLVKKSLNILFDVPNLINKLNRLILQIVFFPFDKFENLKI